MLLLVTGNPNYHDWTENESYSLEFVRLFEYTDRNIIENYKNKLEKLKRFPCLFTYEVHMDGKTIGYIGSIKSINETQVHNKKKVIIKYSLDKNCPSVTIDKNNNSDLLSLGIKDDFELRRVHLEVIPIVFGFSGFYNMKIISNQCG